MGGSDNLYLQFGTKNEVQSEVGGVKQPTNFAFFSHFDHQLGRPFNISMNIGSLGPIFCQH